MRALELIKSKSGVYNPSQEVKSPQLSYTKLICVKTSSFPTIKKQKQKKQKTFWHVYQQQQSPICSVLFPSMHTLHYEKAQGNLKPVFQ